MAVGTIKQASVASVCAYHVIWCDVWPTGIVTVKNRIYVQDGGTYRYNRSLFLVPAAICEHIFSACSCFWCRLRHLNRVKTVKFYSMKHLLIFYTVVYRIGLYELPYRVAPELNYTCVAVCRNFTLYHLSFTLVHYHCDAEYILNNRCDSWWKTDNMPTRAACGSSDKWQCSF